jgi:hypothetical protein
VSKLYDEQQKSRKLERDLKEAQATQQSSCGYGYKGDCCCECALRLDSHPRCECLGGRGTCGKSDHTYVCIAMASEGIAFTDWADHGSCEMWMAKPKKGKSDDS